MEKIKLLSDYGTMGSAAQAFKEGKGDFVHLQEPLPSMLVEEETGYIVASVGKTLGPLAFSTLAMSRKFIESRSEAAEAFMRAYYATLRWIEISDPEEIVAATHQLYEGIPKSVLIKSVINYKSIGAWRADPEISEESYERMVDMWLQAGHMKKRYLFEQVVFNDLAEKVRIK
jgi:NitT/TauT family transport system substrate-binding protein